MPRYVLRVCALVVALTGIGLLAGWRVVAAGPVDLGDAHLAVVLVYVLVKCDQPRAAAER